MGMLTKFNNNKELDRQVKILQKKLNSLKVSGIKSKFFTSMTWVRDSDKTQAATNIKSQHFNLTDIINKAHKERMISVMAVQKINKILSNFLKELAKEHHGTKKIAPENKQYQQRLRTILLKLKGNVTNKKTPAQLLINTKINRYNKPKQNYQPISFDVSTGKLHYNTAAAVMAAILLLSVIAHAVGIATPRSLLLLNLGCSLFLFYLAGPITNTYEEKFQIEMHELICLFDKNVEKISKLAMEAQIKNNTAQINNLKEIVSPLLPIKSNLNKTAETTSTDVTEKAKEGSVTNQPIVPNSKTETTTKPSP